MDLQITGATALVLGAGGGLGGAVTDALAAEGANVVLADRDADAVAAGAAAAAERGVTALPLQWELADLDAVDERVGEIERRVGPVDILVNITGGPAPGPASGQGAEVWRDAFQTMVAPVIAITDRVLPGMRERGWGRIITSASSGVVAPIPDLGLSNTLRSSLLGWSKTLAREVGGSGITANVVVPGRIATSRVHFLDEKKAEREGRPVADVVAQSTGGIPAGRYGDPGEFGSVVAFLAGKGASYVNGSIVRVDGGLIPSI